MARRNGEHVDKLEDEEARKGAAKVGDTMEIVSVSAKTMDWVREKHT